VLKDIFVRPCFSIQVRTAAEG